LTSDVSHDISWFVIIAHCEAGNATVIRHPIRSSATAAAFSKGDT
jgi:hypothetical protein